ncbi:MAG: hypothetical protein ACPHDN_02615 [Candidatus Puniceispirillaceae bacterium]
MSLPSSESSWPKEAARHDRVLVVLATPVSGCFDYLVPPHLSVVIGSVVVAPFGNRCLPGIVLGPGTGDVAVENCAIWKRSRLLPLCQTRYCCL